MDLLRSGHEGHFCELNAILTFREWFNDFTGEPTHITGKKVTRKELEEVEEHFPELYSDLPDSYRKASNGTRDLYCEGITVFHSPEPGFLLGTRFPRAIPQEFRQAIV